MPTDTASQPQLGMISSYEQEYLRRYARYEYSGQGEIVDLGCWLGSSTIELAKGLQENPQAAGRKIHAYDLFIWETWMDPLTYVVGTPLEGRFKPGDSFLQECIERTLPWQNQIEFHPGDLNQLGWQGGAIEFLFIDAMKTWELANTIIHDFFPALIPGRSVVVHQDFCHHYPYWIHLTMYRLREYFEPVYDIPFSASLVYRYVKQIPEDLLKATYAVTDFSEEEIHAAFDYSSRLVSIDKKPVILSGKVTTFTELGAPNQKYQVNDAFNGIYAIHSEISHLRFQLEQTQARLRELEQQPVFVTASVQPDKAKFKLKQKLQSTREQMHQLEAELHSAKGRIEAMESSKFWQLRTQWFRFKKTLGFSVEE